MRTEPDVEPLVWGVGGFGILEVVTVVTLLVSGHFRDRWFLLVVVVPALAGVAVWGVLHPPEHRGRSRHARGD